MAADPISVVNSVELAVTEPCSSVNSQGRKVRCKSYTGAKCFQRPYIIETMHSALNL